VPLPFQCSRYLHSCPISRRQSAKGASCFVPSLTRCHRGIVQYASDPELGEVPHIRTPVRIGEGVRVRNVAPKPAQCRKFLAASGCPRRASRSSASRACYECNGAQCFHKSLHCVGIGSSPILSFGQRLTPAVIPHAEADRLLWVPPAKESVLSHARTSWRYYLRNSTAPRPLDHDGGPMSGYAASLKSPICASNARLKAGRAVQRST
jgi:hypothetical protein